MKRIEWPTAAVVIAGVCGVVALAALGFAPEVIAAYASAAIAAAGGMKRLLQDKE